MCELWTVSSGGQELVQNCQLDCCFTEEAGLSSLGVGEHSQAASMFLGVSHGACVLGVFCGLLSPIMTLVLVLLGPLLPMPILVAGLVSSALWRTFWLRCRWPVLVGPAAVPCRCRRKLPWLTRLSASAPMFLIRRDGIVRRAGVTWPIERSRWSCRSLALR